MKKFPVLIVEDEPSAGRYIERIVNQTDGFSVSCVCESAEEALTLLSESEVYVIITDIKMADMSGLELLEIVHQKKPQIQSVVISGYDYFEYAKKAITLGVSGYLLKPIDQDELLETLEKIHKTIELQQQMQYKDYLNTIEEKSAEYINNPEKIPFREFSAMMVAGSFDINELIIKWQSDYTLSSDMDIELLYYRYSLVVLESTENVKTNRKLTKLANSVLLSYGTGDDSGVVVIRDERITKENFGKTLKEMYSFLENSYCFGRLQFLTYLKNSSQMQITEPEKKMSESMAQSLTSGNEQEMLTQLDNIVDYWEKNNLSLQSAKQLVYTMSICAFRLTSNQIDPAIEISKIVKKLYRCKSYEQSKIILQSYIMNLMHNVTADNDDLQTQGYKTYMKIADFLGTYIDKNYTLQEISSMFNYSQPYISKLFRRYAGTTYKEYITNLKIDTAIKIIENDKNVLIKDVAERLGYDQLYFSTVFHRVIGQYPKQYREKIK